MAKDERGKEVGGEQGMKKEEKEPGKLQATFQRWHAQCDAYEQQQLNTPDNLVTLKFAVALTLGLLVWCYYVYVGRACVPMIRGDSGRRGSRAEGVVFLVLFNILWWIAIYTYALIVLTPPGFAKDHVQQEPCPEPPFPAQTSTQLPFVHDGGASAPNRAHSSFQVVRQPQPTMPANGYPPYRTDLELSRPTTDSTLVAAHPGDGSGPEWQPSTDATQNGMDNGTAGYPSHAGHTNVLRTTEEDRLAERHAQKAAFGPQPGKVLAGVSNAGDDSSQPDVNPGYAMHHTSAQTMHPQTADINMQGNGQSSAPRKVFREPPLSLPLHPYSRYCNKCQIVKPLRTHHCRHCGTCVLNMDHHCPWIGQCVGARNHVYFIAFCFWTSICLGYVFVTLLVTLIAPGISPRPSPAIDGQILAICILSFIFSFFTGSMGVTHVRLIALNQSTLENMTIAATKQRESARLNREYGLCKLSPKRRERAAMDAEWGNLDREVNLFWTGDKAGRPLSSDVAQHDVGTRTGRSSAWRNWEAVMGTKVWAWILPPPRYHPDDGLDYPVNPRRGPQGEWRRRTEWPAELQ